MLVFLFFFNATATTEIYTLSLHDALPISAGGFVTEWGTNGNNNTQFNRPMHVAVAPDGSVYVVDYKNHRIQKFTSEGIFVIEWGTNGEGVSEFKAPWGVAVAPDGSVYVADTSNDRIQKFSVGP